MAVTIKRSGGRAARSSRSVDEGSPDSATLTREAAMVRRHLLCRLRLHRERRVRVHDGWVYRCRRCGREKGQGPLITLMGAEGGGL